MKKVIIDTGPLLAFAKAGRVNTLKNLFKQLIISEEVGKASKDIITRIGDFFKKKSSGDESDAPA